MVSLMFATLCACGSALLGILVSEPIQTDKKVNECPTSLLLYYSSSCWHSRKVLDYLEENHLSLPMKDVSVDKKAKEELQLKGGLLIVPCLLINGQPLYDDTTIIQWINDHRVCLVGKEK